MKNFYGKLLSPPTYNYKLSKNIKLKVHTYSLNFAHSDLSGYNVCPFANKLVEGEQSKNKSSCSSVCVGYRGNAQRFKSIMQSRIKKTKMFFNNREEFLKLLIKDIKKAIAFSQSKGFKASFRLNAYSDIKWENIKIDNGEIFPPNIFELFSDQIFYDYTKHPNRTTPNNYHLTYSHWGNWDHTQQNINNRNNIAMVFNELPNKYKNIKVVNGDDNDLRTPQNDGNGVIVGLKFKGSKKDLNNGITEGFVVEA